VENIIIIIGIAFFFVFSTLLGVFSPKIKGSFGEKRVAFQLSRLKSDEYTIFNNILLYTDRSSTQIDHLVISIFGIFVIETKNYKGWIHGHEKSEYWTQSIYSYKTKFRNPIRQNWSHILALKEVLSGMKQNIYHSIVVFAGSGELKNIHTKNLVIYDYQLHETIIRLCTQPVLSFEEVRGIVDKINSEMIQDRQARKAHVQQVRSREFRRVMKHI